MCSLDACSRVAQLDFALVALGFQKTKTLAEVQQSTRIQTRKRDAGGESAIKHIIDDGTVRQTKNLLFTVLS